ncbi:MAG: TlpA disulfide reductase family protein [Candidatus Nanopelagicales bacterium]|nr:TlpA disulfide reductase family protein [Candidatus Nanopelagicales bacterium]
MRVLLLTAAAVLALSACSSGAPSSDSGFVAGDGSIVVIAPDQRQPAPDVRGTTLDGSVFTLADHRGDVVVMNVWASWCAPCRAEAPALAEVATRMAAKGVTFVGIDTRDSTATAQSFVDKFQVPYPSIVDPDGQVQLLFGDSLPPQAIPSTVVIDRQGRVAARALGRVDAATLRGIIEPLLGS